MSIPSGPAGFSVIGQFNKKSIETMNCFKRSFSPIFGTLGLICGFSIYSPAYALEPRGFDLGPLKFTPQISLDQLNDSNIYSANSTLEQEQSSAITVISPELKILAKDQNREYSSRIYLSNGAYSDTRAGEDDYTDYGASLGANFGVGSRRQLGFEAGRDRLHDARGSAFTAGIPNTILEPDEYDNDKFSANFSLGNQKSKMRLKLGLDNTKKEYVNNLTTTGARNYSTLGFNGAYYYQGFAKLDLFISGNSKTLDYEVDNPNGSPVQTFDGDENSVQVGIQWESTAKTTGSIQAGVTNKNFDDPTLENINSSAAWAIDIQFDPTKRTSFKLGSTSAISENEGSGTAKESIGYNLGWNQTWPLKINTTLVFAFNEDEHSGSTRVDEVTSTSFSLGYPFRRWLEFKLGYDLVDNDSSDPLFIFEKNTFKVGIAASF